MSAELLVNVTPQETRVALVENGVLQEVQIERSAQKGIVGNIYKGTVSRVLPGMEAAFIDIGQERAAFLHISDLPPPLNETIEKSEVSNDLSIRDLLYEGKKLLVQAIKEPLGTKGARLTAYVTTPSRYLVLMPDSRNIGVSSKISSEEERKRLKQVLQQLKKEENCQYGYIIRTAAEGASEDSLRREIRFLNKVWQCMQEAVDVAEPGSLIYSDLPIVQRILRDMVGEKLNRILIDSRETVARVQQFCQSFIPELANIIEHYPGERPLFDLHGVEDEIQKALEKKVQLKSGGYIIIEQTEAMTTIDVNTGAFVGHRTLEETIFKTNLQAAQAIARQIRLRNLGGIIILDFIDMELESHRQEVLQALEKALDKDFAKTYISNVSPLGLVEMTRKRTRESLEHVLCEPCPTCSGTGYIKTAETVCYEVFREILRESRQFNAKEFLILASQEVVDLLLDEEASSLLELQEFIDTPIRFQAEMLYTQEQYDVVLL
ncbi:MAG: ribonuclease G [bacterium]